jgi:hypothetical protein
VNGLCKSCGEWRRLVVQVVISPEAPKPGADVSVMPTGYICQRCADEVADDQEAFDDLFADCPICALNGPGNH